MNSDFYIYFYSYLSQISLDVNVSIMKKGYWLQVEWIFAHQNFLIKKKKKISDDSKWKKILAQKLLDNCYENSWSLKGKYFQVSITQFLTL